MLFFLPPFRQKLGRGQLEETRGTFHFTGTEPDIAFDTTAFPTGRAFEFDAVNEPGGGRAAGSGRDGGEEGGEEGGRGGCWAALTDSSPCGGDGGRGRGGGDAPAVHDDDDQEAQGEGEGGEDGEATMPYS